MAHPRLTRRRTHRLAPTAVVHEADGFVSRLLGLARMSPYELPAGHSLLLRRCSSIHTFGMRFALDVAFAAPDGTVLRVIRGVPPNRVRRCPNARLVLETHAGELGRFLEDGRGAGSRLSSRIPRDEQA